MGIKDCSRKSFWAVVAVVDGAAEFWGHNKPPSIILEQNPSEFHGRSCGDNVSLWIFKISIWLIL